MGIRKRVARIPILGEIARNLYRTLVGARTFPGSAQYWEGRYQSGGNSGVGSYNKFAEFKSEVINGFIAKETIASVIEFGCGDGNQLRLAQYPRYLGFDISDTAIAMCKKAFALDPSKTFETIRHHKGETAELGLSLDVIYHLVEEAVFLDYIRLLFSASTRFVIIYSSDTDDNVGYEGSHVLHRKITRFIENNVRGWHLYKHIPNRYPYTGNYRTGSFSEFFIYRRG